MRKRQWWWSYALVVVVAYALTVVLSTAPTPLRGELGNFVFDQYQRWLPRPSDLEQPVRVVNIDDASIQRIGRWPWPRQTMAAIVEALSRANVAAVGFDVLFSEKDQPSDDVKACAQRAFRTADQAAHCAERVDGDVAFANAIAGRPIVLGSFFTTVSGGNSEFKPKAGFAFIGDAPNPFLNEFNGGLVPIAVLAAPARGLGFLNWLPDNDRVIRRVPLLLDVNGEVQPSLVLEMLRVAQGSSSYVVKSAGSFGQTSERGSVGVEAIKVGDAVIPSQADGSVRVWFAKLDPRRSIPAWKVLEP